MSARQFRSVLEQNHINKQIMQDTTISDRLLENKAAAAQMRYDSGTDDTDTDTDTEFGGVVLDRTPSIIDSEGGHMYGGLKPLNPEYDLISLHDVQPPKANNESEQWPRLSSPFARSMRNSSVSSQVPSVNGTDLSASEFASRISRLNISSATSRGSSVDIDSFPSLKSQRYAASVTSDAASDATASVSSGRPPSAWTTGAAARALFPNAESTPTSEYDDEDYDEVLLKDFRQVRWWDPDHEDFEPDYFRNKELIEARSFGCPFADCEDSYGYDTIDVLKSHLRHAHLTLDHRCPCCHKSFARPSALMAHTESNGRCKVQGSTYFKQLLADISGGFLKAKRVKIPKIFRQDKAMVLANGTPANGIMQMEYEAKLPRTK